MKKLPVLVFVLSVFTLLSCGSPNAERAQEEAKMEIIQVMKDQESAWNRGDMPGFMEGYAQSDSTLFVGKTRVNYGWQTVLDSYLKAYPDKSAMGTLQFDLIRVVPIDENHAYVVGKWSLTNIEKPASGHFVLIFEKAKQGWRIIVDGTS